MTLATSEHPIGRSWNPFRTSQISDKPRDSFAQSLFRFFFLAPRYASRPSSHGELAGSRHQPFLPPSPPSPSLSPDCICCCSQPGMAHNRLARVALVWTFVPGLALCIACARVLRYITPAIGAVPLLFSSAFSLFLLSNESHTAASGRPTHAHDDDGGESHLRPGPDEVEEEEGLEARHPVLVFFADMILATALFAVLFDSWTGWAPHAAGTPGAMLVAYTTMPLLINLYVAISPALCAMCASLESR